MIARGFLSLHRAALSAPLENSTNSNYSRTGHPTKDVHPEPAEGLFSDSSVLLTNSPNSNYSRTGHPTKDVHPEPAEGLFSDSSVLLTNSPNSNYSRTGHPTKDVHPEPAEGLFSDSSVLLTNSPNSNYSHTYATPGGRGCTGLLVRPLPQLLCFPCLRKKGRCTPAKMSARRHLLSLFSQSPLSTLLRFNYLRTLSFSVSHVSFIPPTPSALFHQKT